jgi:hypothetical protein
MDALAAMIFALSSSTVADRHTEETYGMDSRNSTRRSNR